MADPQYIVLWDRKSPIHWHWFDKQDWTVEMIKSNPEKYNIPLDQEVILFTDGRGGTYNWTLLEMWKSQYGVDLDDAQEALYECMRIRNIPEVTLNDVETMVDSLAEAYLEHDETIEYLVGLQEANAAAIEEIIPLLLGE